LNTSPPIDWWMDVYPRGMALHAGTKVLYRCSAYPHPIHPGGLGWEDEMQTVGSPALEHRAL
jgi:hypothetical protein